MSFTNYSVTVGWDPNLHNVGFADATQYPGLKGLAINAIKITTGAPDTLAGHWLPSAQVQNTVDGTWYIMTGTTASPAWTLINGTNGITQLTGDVIAGPGTGSQAATIGSKKVTGAKLVTGTGYFTATTLTNGTTPVNVFGATVPFSGTITGIFVISDDTTAGNITVADTAGTVATIAKGTTSGLMTGAASLANTAITLGNTLTVVSSSAGNARVVITFTTA